MISGNGQTCPGCGRDDLTQAVPAAYLAGRTAVTSRERDMDGDSRTVTRRETTALSAALAPVPKGPTYALGCLGALAGVVAVGAFLGWIVMGKAVEIYDDVAGGVGEEGADPYAPFPSDPGPDASFLGWLSLVALCAVVVVAVVLVRRRNAFARLTRGRQRAEALWARGWYCHRCGTAHFADVPGEDVRPLTLQEFRERVWEAGGYGDLAAQRRAID
ncbi:hypothetical protein SLA_3137 [Streptomyces laurentii]|uniref:Uncharacterized protein n=1 Tax=Streptomyces laurentii TaxID=39478 RepID=A0A160P0W5_STRLU|nr:hypothetical protein SLA_3137 [Streptomyces laurentii]